jgi:hypothetical protein
MVLLAVQTSCTILRFLRGCAWEVVGTGSVLCQGGSYFNKGVTGLHYDVFSGTALLVVGSLFAVGAYFIIVVLEALLLRYLKWGPFWNSIKTSAIMNLASALVGVLMAGIIFDLQAWGYLLAWALSIGIEGGVLTLMNQRMGLDGLPLSRTWLIAFVANTASYLLFSCSYFGFVGPSW